MYTHCNVIWRISIIVAFKNTQALVHLSPLSPPFSYIWGRCVNACRLVEGQLPLPPFPLSYLPPSLRRHFFGSSQEERESLATVATEKCVLQSSIHFHTCASRISVSLVTLQMAFKLHYYMPSICIFSLLLILWAWRLELIFADNWDSELLVRSTPTPTATPSMLNRSYIIHRSLQRSLKSCILFIHFP